MLLERRSYAFEVQPLCFRGAIAMLLRCRSYAFEVPEHSKRKGTTCWCTAFVEARECQRLGAPRLYSRRKILLVRCLGYIAGDIRKKNLQEPFSRFRQISLINYNLIYIYLIKTFSVFPSVRMIYCPLARFSSRMLLILPEKQRLPSGRCAVLSMSFRA